MRCKRVSVKHLLVGAANAKLREYFHTQYTCSPLPWKDLSCVVSFFTVILQNSFRDNMGLKKTNAEKPKRMISLAVKKEIMKKKQKRCMSNGFGEII